MGMGKMNCPYCGNEDIVKAGKRYNKYVTKQLYKNAICAKEDLLKEMALKT